jgi:hypothetical protein
MLGKLTLLALTSLLSLGMLECAARQIIDPVDVLVPVLLEDQVLRWRVEPRSAGHDDWGFRNREVPDKVDVVAIGDSQTYGAGSRARDTWPAWLGRLADRSIYNISLGGYGPIDYMALVEQKALTLSPEHIFVGLYLGNDLVDAWRSIYTKEAWTRLRDPDFAFTEPKSEDEQILPATLEHRGTIESIVQPLREWLHHSSVVYRTLAVGFGDRIRGFMLQHEISSNPNHTVLWDAEGEVVTTFDFRYRFQSVDFDDPRVGEGVRLSIEALQEMADMARAGQVGFTVVVIPTKDRVFAPDLLAVEGLRDADVVRRLSENESLAEAQIVSSLRARGIDVVLTLPALRANRHDGIYPKSSDGHPNREGYRVIAELAEGSLREGS